MFDMIQTYWMQLQTSHIVIGCGGIILLWICVRKMSARRRPMRKDPGSLILHQMPRGPWAPSLSPFPLKLETYLRMANLKYTVDFKQPTSSKRKTPWMTHDGTAVADSHFCIEHLNRLEGIDLMKHLSPDQRAIAWAFQKMLEENTYWTMCMLTFGDDLSTLKSLMPYPAVMRFIISRVIRFFMQRQLWGHGMGRHTVSEVLRIARRDLEALSNFIGDKDFLMGDEPCEVDCAVFGMLCQICYHMPGQPQLIMLQESYTNLLRYVERMKERFWPDWDQCITHGHTKKATK